MDLSNIRIIDAHAHPFMPTREKEQYEYAFSMCVHKGLNDFKYLASYQMAVQEYKKYWGLKVETKAEDVVALRNKKVSDDYEGFVKELYEDAGIEAIISDFGFPITGDGLREEEYNVFLKATEPDCKVYDLIRIETTCDRYLYQNGMSFEKMLQAFDEYCIQYIKTHHVVGIKTVFGYYSGVQWESTSYEEAENNFKTIYNGRYNPKREDKPFRDYMVYRGLELANRFGLVFQIHTGVGDPPACDLRLMNPNDLFELLNTELAMQTKIVIVHAGFPYGYEAAFLAANYPNVYTDISSTVSYLGRAVETELRKVLNVCPHNKIMFGSDGGGFVDQSWLAAKYFRNVLKETLEEYIEKGYFTEEYALEIAEKILSGNARRIYDLE